MKIFKSGGPRHIYRWRQGFHGFITERYHLRKRSLLQASRIWIIPFRNVISKQKVVAQLSRPQNVQKSTSRPSVGMNFILFWMKITRLIQIHQNCPKTSKFNKNLLKYWKQNPNLSVASKNPPSVSSDLKLLEVYTMFGAGNHASVYYFRDWQLKTLEVYTSPGTENLKLWCSS